MRWKRIAGFVAAFAIIVGISGMAMTATHTEFVTGNPEYQAKDNSVYIISNTVDFSDLSTTGNGTTGSLSGVTRGDTVQLLDVPAGTIVLDVGFAISTAWTTSGLTCAGITIGDGTDPNGWLKSVDFGNTASGVSVASGVSSMSVSAAWPVTGDYRLTGGKYYTTADTIDAVMPLWANTTTAGVTDAVIIIWAECIKPSSQEAYSK